ncbi:zinc ribbon domain-containing protein [Peribacillus asahii]|uniref:zinc ribbon domain-containing protein n=1 Tax=Peribacillus asahii TaxID=228899 RepID=UPI002079FAD0|nr:zinc ribbon domain-containing protein [Peribacillus asahii]USK69666.1 zinc-ribbon domain-containing protein [Peribacillus asahii]
MHCNNCGEKVKKEQTFCTNCGATIQQLEPMAQQRSDSRVPVSFLKSKKSKVLAIIGLLVVVLGFGGYTTLQALNKSVKTVQKFEKAVETKNAKELADLLNSGQELMEVKKADATMLLHYFEENPDILAETKSSLRKESQLLENTDILRSNSEGLLTLVESKKKWGMIEQYGLSFQPVYIKVYTNQDKTMLSINDKEQGELKESDEKTVGPLLPIEYEVKGAYKGQYATVKDVVEVDPIEEDTHKISVELDLTGDEVSLYSNMNQATVFINGKSTGKTVAELNTIGPVSTDGSLKIHAEAKVEGKTLKSETIAVTESDEELDLFIDDSAIREAAEKKAEQAAAAEEAKQDAVSEIESVIYDHYSYISYDNYSAAYDLFSKSRKDKNSYSNWEKGLLENDYNDVKKVVVDSVSGDTATASFEMVSRDSTEDGTLVQTWRGKWHLVKEFSGWKLSKPEIKLLDSRTE